MKYLDLENGQKMPVLGLGLWQATNPEELEVAVNKALEVGYRHFDTAYMYLNEAVFGSVLKKWLDSGKVKREELFITTKLPPIGNTPEKVNHFFQLSLKALQLDYVDLYLIHTPVGMQYVDDDTLWPKDAEGNMMIDMSTNLLAVWKEMEKLVETGRAKNIGISNFTVEQVERIVKNAKIRPANHQIEMNAYFQQTKMVAACKKLGITVVAYAPLGSPGRKLLYKERGVEFTAPPIMDEPKVLELGKKYNKTPAQILLRHLVQLGVAPIPKSTNPERLVKNIEIFDFELTSSEMEQLQSLDKGTAGRTFNFAFFPGIDKHPEFPRDD